MSYHIGSLPNQKKSEIRARLSKLNSRRIKLKKKAIRQAIVLTVSIGGVVSAGLLLVWLIANLDKSGPPHKITADPGYVQEKTTSGDIINNPPSSKKNFKETW